MTGLSIEEGIKQVYNGLRHVVILGAGASIASTMRNPEKGGKLLPSMNNFIDVVGLNDLMDQVPTDLRSENFETVYGNLFKHDPKSAILEEIQARTHSYFEAMKLPDEPTIYDYLVLSLRSKDHVATFNWDPFLYQAFDRNRKFTKDLPYMSFLHGTVALGYSKEDKRSGPIGYQARREGGIFEPVPLLYPVGKKDYAQSEFIVEAWDDLKRILKKESKSVRTTIFGYGAPLSDVEAVSLLNESWGTPDDRDMEQFEIVDITEEAELRERWKGFIHSHHYDVSKDYFRSSLAYNPRRTCESYFSHNMPMTPNEAFRNNNPVPGNFRTLEDLWKWHEPLIEAETKAKES